MSLKISPSWDNIMKQDLESNYFQEIFTFLKQEKTAGKIIYPCENDIFRMLKLTPVENIKVVIIGQDPYHGEGQAHGLSFSVRDGIKIPPSLKNIYKELSLEYTDFQTPLS